MINEELWPFMGYWVADFDTFEAAAMFQKEKLQLCMDQGWPIRATEIMYDTDFDTKKGTVRAFVRPFRTVIEQGPW